jgi:sensor histidine kinase YesM
MKKPCVDIRLSTDNGIVVFEVSNYYEKNVNSRNTGHSGYGLINLKKRLDLAYPGKYQLIIEPDDLLYHGTANRPAQ